MRHFLSDLSWGEEASMLKQVQSIYSNIRMEMVIITQYSVLPNHSHERYGVGEDPIQQRGFQSGSGR